MFIVGAKKAVRYRHAIIFFSSSTSTALSLLGVFDEAHAQHLHLLTYSLKIVTPPAQLFLVAKGLESP